MNNQTEPILPPMVEVSAVIPPNQYYFIRGEIRISQGGKEITENCKPFTQIDDLKERGKKDADRRIGRKTKQDRFARYYDQEHLYVRAEGSNPKQLAVINDILAKKPVMADDW